MLRLGGRAVASWKATANEQHRRETWRISGHPHHQVAHALASVWKQTPLTLARWRTRYPFLQHHTVQLLVGSALVRPAAEADLSPRNGGIAPGLEWAATKAPVLLTAQFGLSTHSFRLVKCCSSSRSSLDSTVGAGSDAAAPEGLSSDGDDPLPVKAVSSSLSACSSTSSLISLAEAAAAVVVADDAAPLAGPDGDGQANAAPVLLTSHAHRTEAAAASAGNTTSAPSDAAATTPTSSPAEAPAALPVGAVLDQGGRGHMEDCLLVQHWAAGQGLAAALGTAGAVTLLAVFDGHNGQQASTYLRDHTAGAVMAAAQHHAAAAGIPAAPGAVLRCALAQLERALVEAGQAAEAGSTALLSLVLHSTCGVPGQVHTANVGDCRAVVDEAGKPAQALSRDHTPGTHREERARLEAAGVQVEEVEGECYCWHPAVVGTAQGADRIQLTRSLGDVQFKRVGPARCTLLAEPEVTSYALSSGTHFLVLGSDGCFPRGLHNGDAVREVRRVLAGGGTAGQAAQALVALARRLGSVDNAAALVLRLGEVAPAGSPANSRLFRRQAAAAAN